MPVMGRRTRIVRAIACVTALSVVGVFVGGCAKQSQSAQRHTYTGTVVAVCSHMAAGIPDCFAITPDPGTAYKDGYYAGGGAVTFERPPAGGQIPRVGDRLTVTVVMIPNRMWLRDTAYALSA
jgi:hypothetical protein